MLFKLISSFFGWLPAGIYLPVLAVISVALLIILVRIILIVLDFIMKFIELFTW